MTSVLAKLIDEWYLFRKFDVAHRGKETLFTPDRQKVRGFSFRGRGCGFLLIFVLFVFYCYVPF